MADIAVRIIVAGQVQGVGFRLWTIMEAGRRGLRGWVRNRRDGTVEALFIGPADAVAAMIESSRRGPRHAQVTNLSHEPASDDGTSDFHERATV